MQPESPTAPVWIDPEHASRPLPPLSGGLSAAEDLGPDRARWLVESVRDVIFEADPMGCWTYLNPAWARILGHPVEDCLGRAFLEFVHPDDRQANLDKFIAVVNGPYDSCRFEARYLTADGGIRRMEIHAWIIRGPGRESLGSTGTLTDVTARREAEDALAAREQRLAALVQNASDAIVVCDADGVITWAGPGYGRMVGAADPDVVGSRVTDHVAPEDRAAAEAALRRAASPVTAAQSHDLRFLRPGGGRRHLELIVTGRLADPAVAGIVINARDVSERKAFELELQRRATHDALTGLPNRELLVESLAAALGPGHKPGGLIFLDLDRFKVVNDSLGHDAGDQVLRTVAARLQGAARPGDTVARFGGDEFVVVCEEGEPHAVLALAQSLQSALAVPIWVGGRELSLTASVGVRHFGPRSDAALDEAPTPETLLRDADGAMYEAKEGGRNQVSVCHPGTRARALARLDAEVLLRKAIEQDSLLLYGQSQVSLRTHEVVGTEVLVRWRHPTRGLVGPDEFIGLAEETGLIVPLGGWVLERACDQLAEWQRQGRTDVRMSINVSARQLLTGVVAELAAVLASSGADPSGLCLELTESALLHDLGTAAAVMGALADLGVTLSIDDFGTGFSSLAYLQRLPLHQLKIDRSFVESVGRSDGQAIVKAVVGLAHALNLETVAEGVEREDQEVILAGLGCDAAQGYLYAHPVPLADVLPARQPAVAAAAPLFARP